MNLNDYLRIVGLFVSVTFTVWVVIMMHVAVSNLDFTARPGIGEPYIYDLRNKDNWP